MTLFEQLEALMEADTIIQEVTKPKEDKSVNRLLTRCGVLIQANMLINGVECDYDGKCFIIINPIKSKPIR